MGGDGEADFDVTKEYMSSYKDIFESGDRIQTCVLSHAELRPSREPIIMAENINHRLWVTTVLVGRVVIGFKAMNFKT